MPAKTISQLTQATTIASGDEFAIEQSGVTKRIAASVVRGDIANANISASAAIAHSKLAPLNSAQILVGNGSNVPTAVSVTGDVTISNAGVTAIAAGAVVTADVADGAITAPKLSGAQTGSAPIYGCRAWVNFDGTRNGADTGASTNGANVKIRASGNVASVLKNGTGDYTITFATAMADAHYAVTGTASLNASSAAVPRIVAPAAASGLASSNCQVRTADDTGSYNDCAVVTVAIFR